MADLFLSYSQKDKPTVEQLSKRFEDRGYSVWWDVELLPGNHFRKKIELALHEARAVVVLWSEHAINSDYVEAEAETARSLGKLIQLRTPEIAVSLIPIPFRNYQIGVVDHEFDVLNAVYLALLERGILPTKSRALDQASGSDKTSNIGELVNEIVKIRMSNMKFLHEYIEHLEWYISKKIRTQNLYLHEIESKMEKHSLFTSGSMVSGFNEAEERNYLARYEATTREASQLLTRDDFTSPSLKDDVFAMRPFLDSLRIGHALIIGELFDRRTDLFKRLKELEEGS